MLCLSREEGETIVIGENVTVYVLRKKGGGLMLGIDAPKETPVRRGELPPRDGRRE